MTETKPEYNDALEYPYDRPFPNRPRQVITYPYPPFVVLPDGTWYEMPDIYTLAQLVYDLRNKLNSVAENCNYCSQCKIKRLEADWCVDIQNRVNELEGGKE